MKKFCLFNLIFLNLLIPTDPAAVPSGERGCLSPFYNRLEIIPPFTFFTK